MLTEEVFRFLNVRPVQLPPEDRIVKRFAIYDTSAKSPVHLEVEILTGPDARQQAAELARQRLAAPADTSCGREASYVVDEIRSE